jgi:Helix-turn-helix domain
MKVGDYCHAVIEAGKLTMPQQAALWMIARYVNHDTGATFVSMARIAKVCGVKPRQISEHVDALAAADIFRLAPRINGRSQLIQFPLHPTLTGYLDHPQPLRSDAGVRNPQPLRSGAQTPALQRTNPRARARPNSYNPIEPAPRCHRCAERHNVDARCPALAAAR